MIRTHWRRRGPKIERPSHLGVVGVDLTRPHISVAEKSYLTDGKSERRSVGLTIEQGGVRVDVLVTDLRGLLDDLLAAAVWCDDAPTK